jgi:hypothetical protein
MHENIKRGHVHNAAENRNIAAGQVCIYHRSTSQGDRKFTGTSGAIRQEGDSLSLVLIAGGEVSAKGYTLKSAAPASLVIRNGARERTVAFDWHGGLRYPRLERIPGTRDRLSEILAPRTR